MDKLNKILKFLKEVFNPYQGEILDEEPQVDDLVKGNAIHLPHQEIDVIVNQSESADSQGQKRPIVSSQSESTVRNKDLGDNAIDLRENLIKKIIDTLVPHRGISQAAPIDMTFYVSNPIIGPAINMEFKDLLREKLENNSLSSFARGNIIIVNDSTLKSDAIQIFDGFHVTFESKSFDPPQGDVIAVIKIVDGLGSLAENYYQLDSSKKTVFHIGRGKIEKRSGIYRVNDVVIKDDETDSTVASINRRVSRMQADIIWKNGAFYLHAMPSGCRSTNGSSTKIYREDHSLELRDVNTYEQLYDNDLIEFGNALLLSFRINTIK